MAYRHTKNYYAVIYIKEVPWADGLLPRQYRLATFTPEGERIDDVLLAFRNARKGRTVRMQDDRIVCQDFDTDNYKKPDAARLSEANHFQIQTDGHILPLTPTQKT